MNIEIPKILKWEEWNENYTDDERYMLYRVYADCMVSMKALSEGILVSLIELKRKVNYIERDADEQERRINSEEG